MPALKETLSKAEIAALKEIAAEQIDLEDAIQQREQEQREADRECAEEIKALRAEQERLDCEDLKDIEAAETHARKLIEVLHRINARAARQREVRIGQGKVARHFTITALQDRQASLLADLFGLWLKPKSAQVRRTTYRKPWPEIWKDQINAD